MIAMMGRPAEITGAGAEPGRKMTGEDCWAYYDRSGARIDMWQFALLAEDAAYLIVAADRVGDMLVATAWLGLDHDFGRLGRPLIFETTVYGSGEARPPRRLWASEEQARAGHAQCLRAASVTSPGRPASMGG